MDLPRNVEFVQLEIENYPNKIIPFNADIHIRITVRGNESIDSFRFSMTIFRADGSPVGSFFSSEIHSIQQGQEATFRLELHDLKLVQGLYHAGLATGMGHPGIGHSDFDVILDVLHFEVMAPESNDGICATWTPGWGSIRFNSPKVTQVS
ncbi:Wzt carbohydrate-binding domain-containing protein [Leptolyngbya sp. NIES-2104]|uniref:Wzt carbohydrate-binding domain-containing protein n=1 Tax=Leptolyngbya sp. NIES-2104 TaxID=1552121 RepID=UPI00403FF473